MNTEFEAHRSDFPGFPEGPFVLVAGRLQSEPDLALSAPKCLVLLRRQAAVANARATNLPMGQRYRPPRNNGRNGAIRFTGIVTSARRAGRCIARRNGWHGLDRENRVGLREICRVSRREISQAGRDALALARLAFSFLAHPGSRKYGGGSCNPSVMRSYFA